MRFKAILATIGLLGIITIVIADHLYVSHWNNERKIELRSVAHMCRVHIENSIATRFNAIEALSALFQLHPETRADQFAFFAQLFIQSHPPIRALQFADSQTRVTYVYPPKGNRIVIESPMKLIADPERGDYVKKAIEKKQPTLQGPFDLRQGGLGVVVRKPIFNDNKLIGLAIGVYDVPVLIKESLTGINLSTFNLSLTDNQGRFFYGVSENNATAIKMTAHLADTTWTVNMDWKPDFTTPPFFNRILIWVFGGSFFTAILYIVTQAWRQNQRLSKLVNERTVDLTKVNETLSREITEHLRTTKHLKESETKYRSMMEALSDAVYICSKEFTIEYMNPVMIKRIGRDATGERCHDVFYHQHSACQWCVHQQVQKGQPTEFTLINPIDNRTYRITNLPIRHEDGSYSKMAILRDITDYLLAVAEKEKANAQLQQSQKMEAIGTLAGGIAHDFNNILSSVIGFTELSLDDAPRGSLLAQNLMEVLTAGHRAKDLVRQILTFARKTDKELKPVQVSLIAKEALKLLRSSIPATIEIHENIDSNSLILGDITHIHQIFLNLCTNAAHAMEEKGGVLKVAISDVYLDTDFTQIHKDLTAGNYMKITVSDTGTGIAPSIVPSIFEPYFTTKPTGEGTGMGLAMVHGLIKSYGGEITVKSVIGKGSVFTVYLPVSTQRKEIVSMDDKQPLQQGHEHILLVDDEAPIIKITKRALEQLGYQITAHNNSQAALDDFLSRPDAFDLVITDMTMPHMTGELLATAIMQIRADMPVILCTGYSKKIDEVAAYEMGIKAFIMKPVVKEALASTVRRVLDAAQVA